MNPSTTTAELLVSRFAPAVLLNTKRVSQVTGQVAKRTARGGMSRATPALCRNRVFLRAIIGHGPRLNALRAARIRQMLNPPPAGSAFLYYRPVYRPKRRIRARGDSGSGERNGALNFLPA
jgi:hypothetical protein